MPLYEMQDANNDTVFRPHPLRFRLRPLRFYARAFPLFPCSVTLFGCVRCCLTAESFPTSAYGGDAFPNG